MGINSAFLLIFVSLLIGSMCFFAATVAPTVFKTLSLDTAGIFLRAFFPRYYLWGLALSGLATLIALTVDLFLAITCMVVALLFVIARQVLMPRINQARDDESDGKLGADKRFQTLHLVSVVINFAQLLLLTAVAAYIL
jgi:hypothetical protein